MAKGGQILTQLLLDISANTADLKKGLADAQRSVDNFSGNITKIASTLGIAFGVQEVLNFGFEVSQLAAKAQGVEAAFNKLPNSVRLLNDLKSATQGTVSELELMKRAVQFQNFGLSLEQLPKLLQFASLRAQQTGQDVNYLVDSIVTGLGRKSVLILDNLGISSSQLNAEIAKTGDFMTAAGTIIDQELTKMGGLLETTTTKTNRLNSSFENLKVNLGKKANDSGILNFLLDLANRGIENNITTPIEELNYQILQFNKALSSGNFTGSYAAQLKVLEAAATEAGKKVVILSDGVNKKAIIDERASAVTNKKNEADAKAIPVIENIANLTAKLNSLNELQLTQTGAQLAATNREIESINNKIKALKQLGVVQQQTLSIGATDPNKFNKINTDVGVGDIPTYQMPEIEMPDTTALSQQIEGLNTQMNEYGESVDTTFNQVFAEGVANAIGSLGQLFANGETGFKSFITTMLQGLHQAINGLLAKAIMGLISHEVTTKGVLGLAVASAGIGALTALWQSKMPAFESGGKYNGGLALVGEAGPELINFNRGGRVYNNSDTMKMLGNSDYSNRIELVGVIRGEDIYISNQRVQKQRGKVM